MRLAPRNTACMAMCSGAARASPRTSLAAFHAAGPCQYAAESLRPPRP